jgi:hypothetical protein
LGTPIKRNGKKEPLGGIYAAKRNELTGLMEDATNQLGREYSCLLIKYFSRHDEVVAV